MNQQTVEIEQDYTRDYIRRALTSDERLEEPDKSKCNGTYEALIGLYNSHQIAGAKNAKNSWATLKKMRPELSAFDVEEITIHITELHTLPKPVQITTRFPIYAEGFNVLVGESGSAKSFFALDIAVDIGQSETVVYVAGEGLNGFNDRWKAYSKHYGVATAKVEFYKFHALQIMDDVEFTRFINGIRDKKPAMVIIDTMARSAVGIEENSARDMGIFINRIDAMRYELRCASLVVHHTNKAGVIRGSNSLYGASDAVISMSMSDGVIRASNNRDHGGKNKYDEGNWTKFYRLLPVQGEDYKGAVLVETSNMIDTPSYENPLSTHQKKILEALDGYESGLQAKAIVDATSISQSTAYRNLKQLMKANYIVCKNDRYTITEQGTEALLGGE